MEGEKESENYKMTKEDKKFFNYFADKQFGPSFNVEEFLTVLDKQTKKLLIDVAIFITHPRINKYAGSFVKKFKLDSKIIEFRTEFEEIMGSFKRKLSDEEKTKFNDYWYGKELFRTTIFLLIYTININLRNEEEKTLNEYAVKLILKNKLDEKLFKPILNIIQFITTYGDVFEFYSKSYVDDFEFLFGNYIDPISKLTKDKGVRYKYRQQQILHVINYSNRKYEKMFDAMDSSLRNGLAHKIFYVNEELKNIRFENHKGKLEEIDLLELEDKAFRLNIISYMLAISDEYLLKPSNIAIKHIKAVTKDIICKPEEFYKTWNIIINAICDTLEKNPKNFPYFFLIRNLEKFILKRLVLILVKSLDMFGDIGISYILQFTYQFYILLDTEFNETNAKEFIQGMQTSFNSILIPEDRILEKEIKRFISLIILKFIDLKPKGINSLKQLFESLSSYS